jgi:hypothetical protein
LDQALNVKEFAVLAGISYSVAREWFQLSGFPVICGKVFWQDFVLWRRALRDQKALLARQAYPSMEKRELPAGSGMNWPPKAARILSES